MNIRIDLQYYFQYPNQTTVYFVSKVKIVGDWDLKSTYNLDYTQKYLTLIDGKAINLYGDDIGNIHYGYVGKTIFPAEVLRAAGGLVQILGGEW